MAGNWRRKSFLFSFDAFLALILFGFAAVAVSMESQDSFRENLLTISKADLLEDVLSSLEADGKLSSLAEPEGASFYSETLSRIEVETGQNLCLFLDGTPMYRPSCRERELCSERFFVQRTLLGTVQFRKATLCAEKEDG